MTYFNNAIQTKRELLTRIITLLKEGELDEKIDRLPIEMRPKSKTPIRCCVHKDRAVLKYKIMAILGYNVSDEEDELTSLKEYAQMALKREDNTNRFLTVVDEACSSCVQVNYTVSNLCQGCEGRSCQVNCPKDAIQVINSKALIDHQKCVSCGLCQKACPFHAIAYLPVPCEESCPVNAIKKNKEGIEEIDFDKCINCGKCMVACPFGAIMEKTQILQIFETIKSREPIIALVAPAILGQFKMAPGKVFESIRQLGFTDVIEVAVGAEITAANETKEWQELKESNQSFLTTSCCPAYTSLADKHIPALKPNVSHTKSPMIYTAKLAKEKYPDAKLVFIGPCLAKREEASASQLVDYVITFEELGAFWAAYGIELSDAQEAGYSYLTQESRGFASSGGVTNAIKAALPEGADFKEFVIDGLERKSITLLKSFSKKSPKANFIEIMACQGGCVSGPAAIAPPSIAQNTLKKHIKEMNNPVSV